MSAALRGAWRRLDRLKASGGRCVLALVGALAVSACSGYAPPKPWEKGLLARPEMQFDHDPLDARLTRHIYTSKESASGGHGVGGGGCGCN